MATSNVTPRHRGCHRLWVSRVAFFAHVIAFSVSLFLCASFKALSVFQEQRIAATRLEASIQRMLIFPRERERKRLATSVLHRLSDQKEASN
jgi:signal transduction histidine kinase